MSDSSRQRARWLRRDAWLVRSREAAAKTSGARLRRSPCAEKRQIALTRLLNGGGRALGRRFQLTSVDQRQTRPVPITQTPCGRRHPTVRLPLRQELHELGTTATSLLVRTKRGVRHSGRLGAARGASGSSDMCVAAPKQGRAGSAELVSQVASSEARRPVDRPPPQASGPKALVS
jgi:hypothetical protein